MAKSAMEAGGETQCNVDNTTFAIITGKRSSGLPLVANNPKNLPFSHHFLMNA